MMSRSPFYVKTETDLSFVLRRTYNSTNIWNIEQYPYYAITFIRSAKGASCPSLVKEWQVFDKIRNSWESDKTLIVTCV